MERESIKVSRPLMNKLRALAAREGYVLARLIERLVEAGIRTEGLDRRKK